MPSPAVVREGRIREAIAWSRLQGFASSSPSPMAFSRLTDRFVTEYFYTKKSARELAEATLRRLRVEEQKKDLILSLASQDFERLSDMSSFHPVSRDEQSARLEGIPLEVAELLPVCDRCGHRKTSAAPRLCFNIFGGCEACGCKCENYGRHKVKTVMAEKKEAGGQPASS